MFELIIGLMLMTTPPSEPDPDGFPNFLINAEHCLTWDEYTDVVDGFTMSFSGDVGGGRWYHPGYGNINIVKTVYAIRAIDNLHPLPAPGDVIRLYVSAYRDEAPPGLERCDPTHYCSDPAGPVDAVWPYICEYTSGEDRTDFIQCVVDHGGIQTGIHHEGE